MFKNPLREKLKQGKASLGLWITLEAPAITEIAVNLGLDWITVEMEHGHLDYRNVLEHARAARDSSTAILVRVPLIAQDCIKRVLDMGVHGVLLPLVRARADVERAFRFGRYPPAGERGVGGERAVKWGLAFQEYLQSANEETLLIPIIETREAAQNIDDILGVAGLEAIFFGPADLSASHGYLGQWEGPGLAKTILEIKEKAAGKGIASGILGLNSEDFRRRQEEGFQLIGLGADTSLLIRALQENLQAFGRQTGANPLLGGKS